jgi:hypothetical protein
MQTNIVPFWVEQHCPAIAARYTCDLWAIVRSVWGWNYLHESLWIITSPLGKVTPIRKATQSRVYWDSRNSKVSVNKGVTFWVSTHTGDQCLVWLQVPKFHCALHGDTHLPRWHNDLWMSPQCINWCSRSGNQSLWISAWGNPCINDCVNLNPWDSGGSTMKSTLIVSHGASGVSEGWSSLTGRWRCTLVRLHKSQCFT